MPRHVRTTAAAVLTFGLTMGTAVAATPSTVVTIPGQLVVPAPPEVGRANGLVASANGVAYAHWIALANQETAIRRSSGSTTHHALGLSGTISLVGDQLVGWSYSSGLQLPTLTAVSLSNGTRQDLGVTENPDAYSVTDDTTTTLPRGTGTGWIDARLGVAGTSDALVLSSTVGAPTREYPLPVAGTQSFAGVAADGQGLAATLLYGADRNHTNSASYYLDFASGRWTALDAAGTFSLSPGFLAYFGNGTLYRVPRSDPAAAPERRDVPATILAIAITDTASAWISSPTGYFSSS